LGLDFTPTGSVTLENEFEKVKREGDKSYRVKSKEYNVKCNLPYYWFECSSKFSVVKKY